MGTSRLLAALPQADFALLSPDLKEIALDHGHILYDAGDPIEHVYFPHTAMVSLVVVMQDGAMVETATVGCEGVVGTSANLRPRFALGRAVVQVSGTAAQISFQRLCAAVQRSASLREFIAHYNELLIRQIQQSVACNALHDVEARLSRWLLQTADRIGGDTIPLTQDFLAQMLGVRRTTVTTVARVLQVEGPIKYRRGVIQIVDRRALQARACECYHTVKTDIDLLLGRAAEQ